MEGTPGYSRDSRVQGTLQASPHGTPGEEDSARRERECSSGETRVPQNMGTTDA